MTKAVSPHTESTGALFREQKTPLYGLPCPPRNGRKVEPGSNAMRRGSQARIGAAYSRFPLDPAEPANTSFHFLLVYFPLNDILDHMAGQEP